MKLPEFNRRNIVIFLLSLAFSFLMSNNVWHIQTIITGSMLVFIFVSLTLILTVLLMWAGLLVIRSVFLLAGELSLLVFLIQSYCLTTVPRTADSDHAVISFITLAVTYILYIFLKDIYEKLVDSAKKIRAIDGKWSWEAVIAFVSLFLFVGLFLYMLYLVIDPIMLGSSACIKTN